MTLRVGSPPDRSVPALLIIGVGTLFITPFSVPAGLIAGGLSVLGLSGLSLIPGFRARVDARRAIQAAQQQRTTLLSGLDADHRARYLALEGRCARLDDPGSSDHRLLGETLSQLAWIHLHLLSARQRVVTAMHEVRTVPEPMAAETRARLQGLDDQLGRVEGLLDRLQVESALRESPDGYRHRLEAVVGTLHDTGAWLQGQGLTDHVLAPLAPALDEGSRS